MTHQPQLATHTAPKLGLTRKFSGGGLISSLFGASKPETVAEKFARQDAEFRAKHPDRFQQQQPTEQAAPTQPAAGLGGIRGLVSGSLTKNLQDREKAAGLKAGGMVRKKCVEGGKITGPGGPTDDLVPIAASNGEFMIKASSAKVLGPNVLRALNAVGDTTQAKAPGGAIRKLAMGGEVEMPMNTTAMTAQDQQAFGALQDTATGGAPMEATTPVTPQPTAPRQLKSSTMALLNSYTPMPMPGMPQLKAGGMVRKMATGGLVQDDLDKRVAQIPAGGTAPASDGSSQQSDFMRDVENTANALPGVGGALSGGAALASAVPAVVRSLAAAAPVVRKGLEISKAVAPYAVPAAGFGALQTASSPDTASAASAKPSVSAPGFGISKSGAYQQRQGSLGPNDNAYHGDLTPGINAAMTNSQTDLATTGMRANDIYKTKLANGTTAYSGYGDGTGKVGGMVRGDGTAVQGGGSVSVMPAMSEGAIKSALTNPDGTAWTANDNAIMAANIRDGVDQYRGTSREAKPDPMSKPMTKDQRAAQIRMTEIASQDKRYGEANAIAQENLGMVRSEHTAKMSTQKQLQDAQAEYLAAGDNPVKLKEAERKLILLGGKQPKESRMVVVPGGQAFNDQGVPYTVPARVFDTETKQYVDQQGGRQEKQAAPKVSTQADFDKLAKGDTYTGEDGKTYRK